MPLRLKRPNRSSVQQRARYGSYKPDLRKDFSNRCGYCDGLDGFYGGTRGFQIDHFAPKSLFPELTLAYENLVYSCPFCNRAKSNKWIGLNSMAPHNGLEGFVDPCEQDFENHLDRDSFGKVFAKTEVGEYMVKHLNLRLLRHQYIWQSQKLEELARRINKLLPLVKNKSDREYQLLKMHVEVTTSYFEYRNRAVET